VDWSEGGICLTDAICLQGTSTFVMKNAVDKVYIKMSACSELACGKVKAKYARSLK
jgi:hypothetical protein